MKTELTAVEIAKLQARVDWERTKIPKCADESVGEVMAEIHDFLNTLEPAPEPEPKFSETVRAGDVYNTTSDATMSNIVYVDAVDYCYKYQDRLVTSNRLFLDDRIIRIISRAPVPSLKERVHLGSRFQSNYNGEILTVTKIDKGGCTLGLGWYVSWAILEANYTLLDD